ncbi:N-formimino-L-glutamate deiminase [compost metagenome]
MVAEQSDRRFLRLADEVVGAGQQHRDRAGGGHGGGARVVSMLQMVGRKRAVPRSQGRAMQVGQLVGMQLDRQGERPGRVEDDPHLVGRKGDALTKAVHGVDQSLGSLQPGQHDVMDEIGIAPLVVCRRRMGAEIGRGEVETPRFRQGPRGA